MTNTNAKRKRPVASFTIETWIQEKLKDYCKENNMTASYFVNELLASFILAEDERLALEHLKLWNAEQELT